MPQGPPLELLLLELLLELLLLVGHTRDPLVVLPPELLLELLELLELLGTGQPIAVPLELA